MRLISAQLDAYFADGLWLDNARHANAMARRPGRRPDRAQGRPAPLRVDANEIFVVLPVQVHDALQAAGRSIIPGRLTGRASEPSGWSRPSTPRPPRSDKFLAVAKGSLGSK